jgi:hypothetical protein
MTRPAFLSRWWPLLLLLPVLATLGLHVGWGFQGLYNQDAHAYLRLAGELKAYWKGGPAPVSYWPMGYPTLGALWGIVLGDDRWALLLIAIVGWAALVAGFRRILLDAGADRGHASLYTLLTVGTSPFLLRHGVVVMSDVPAMAFAMWSIRSALRPGVTNSVLALLLAGAAVMLRLPMAVLLAPALLISCWRVILSGGTRERLVLLLAVIGCASLIALALGTALDHPLGLEMRPMNLFQRVFTTVDGEHRFLLPNGLFVLKPLVHPGFLLLAPVCWVFFRKADLRAAHGPVVGASLLAYLLFLGMLPDQNDRLLLPAVPLVALIGWPAFQRLSAVPAVKRRERALVGAVLVAQLLLFARAIAPFVRQDRDQRELAEWVNGHEASTVYTFGVDQALRTYGHGGVVVDLWRKDVDRFEQGALVLFDPLANAEQWKDHAPMRNWQRAVEQGADTLGVRPDGWVLLRVR